MKWAKQGHHVKLVATTNGDIGHWEIAGGPLATRRKKEVEEVARRLGVVNEVLDNHDGELEPTLENRRTVTRLIKQWNADIVITNRPNDYHPDHRYTSVLVQDSAYMVTVPFITPDVPPLKKNPVFLYSSDRFQKPNPFKPDIAISIDDVMEPTLDALLVMGLACRQLGDRPGVARSSRLIQGGVPVSANSWRRRARPTASYWRGWTTTCCVAVWMSRSRRCRGDVS